MKFKLGEVPILKTINRVWRTDGNPLLLGVLTNTFFPGFLGIGSFTSAWLKDALALIAMLFFCSGAQIQFKAAGMSLYKAWLSIPVKCYLVLHLELYLQN